MPMSIYMCVCVLSMKEHILAADPRPHDLSPNGLDIFGTCRC